MGWFITKSAGDEFSFTITHVKGSKGLSHTDAMNYALEITAAMKTPTSPEQAAYRATFNLCTQYIAEVAISKHTAKEALQKIAHVLLRMPDLQVLEDFLAQAKKEGKETGRKLALDQASLVSRTAKTYDNIVGRILTAVEMRRNIVARIEGLTNKE